MFARIGHALGSLVIVLWRRSKREEYPISVHLLVSSGSWHCGLLAAISLESCSEKNWRFVFHDDGSISESQRKQIEITLPSVEFIPRSMAEERMAKVLKDFPKCLKNRSAHNFFLKIFDFQPFTAEQKFIVLDSDVVFFKRPAEILKWAEEDSVQVFYNKDTQEKYCNPRSDLEGAFDFPIWEKFNSGLVLMQSAAMNLPLAESLFEKFEGKAHHPQFFEQTLYCLMSSAWGRGGALPPTYDINWGYLRSPGAVCRHYVGAFKHDLLYIEGATVLFFRLLPKLISDFLRSAFSGFRGVVASILILVGILGAIGWVGHEPIVSGWKKLFADNPFQAVHPRSGLTRTPAKLSSGDPFTIAFLGGSITQNAESEGFITALRKRIFSDFPKVDLKIVNAGMASTDSSWGAKRIDRDVLEHKPDLVFVEFAVNDADRNSTPDMERIVRKIHEANPKTEIVFLYTTSDSAFRKLLKGRLPHAIAEHEKVAVYYGIPSVILGSDLASQIESGEWEWSDFSADACHPTKEGYESYSRDLLSAWTELLKTKRASHQRFPDPLTETFELCAQQLVVSPLPPTAPLSDAQGDTSIEAERLPIIGQEWVGSPVLENPLGSTWKIERAVFRYMPDSERVLSEEVRWFPARWFQEARGFTGERSRILVEASASANDLWIAPHVAPGSVEVPQLRWIAGKSGHYLFEVISLRVAGHVNGPLASAGIHVFLQRPDGRLEKLATASTNHDEALTLRHAVWLDASDALVLRPFANGYEFATFKDFDLRIGLFKNPPAL